MQQRVASSPPPVPPAVAEPRVPPIAAASYFAAAKSAAAAASTDRAGSAATASTSASIAASPPVRTAPPPPAPRRVVIGNAPLGFATAPPPPAPRRIANHTPLIASPTALASNGAFSQQRNTAPALPLAAMVPTFKSISIARASQTTHASSTSALPILSVNAQHVPSPLPASLWPTVSAATSGARVNHLTSLNSISGPRVHVAPSSFQSNPLLHRSLCVYDSSPQPPHAPLDTAPVRPVPATHSMPLWIGFRKQLTASAREPTILAPEDLEKLPASESAGGDDGGSAQKKRKSTNATNDESARKSGKSSSQYSSSPVSPTTSLSPHTVSKAKAKSAAPSSAATRGVPTLSDCPRPIVEIEVCGMCNSGMTACIRTLFHVHFLASYADQDLCNQTFQFSDSRAHSCLTIDFGCPGESSGDNLIVFCDGPSCDRAFHQACFNITKIPSGSDFSAFVSAPSRRVCLKYILQDCICSFSVVFIFYRYFCLLQHIDGATQAIGIVLRFAAARR